MDAPLLKTTKRGWDVWAAKLTLRTLLGREGEDERPAIAVLLARADQLQRTLADADRVLVRSVRLGHGGRRGAGPR